MSGPVTGRISTPAAIGVITRRSLSVYRHTPGLLAVTLAAPLGMMLLFGYVFGGALAGGGDAATYRNWLTPGVLVLVAAMALTSTAGSANADRARGLTARLQAMPLRSAVVPLGSAAAEAITGVAALAVMTGVGYLTGWRIDASPGSIITGFAVLIAFRAALAITGVALGTAIRDELVLQQVAPLIFGAIMLSNVFVPAETMPTGLRQVATWNPVSSVVTATRELFGAPGPADGGAWPLDHPIAASALWIVALAGISTLAAARAYRRD